MDSTPTDFCAEDRRLLRDSLDDFLRANCDFDHQLAAYADPLGFRAGIWQSMAELGWLGVGVPETSGGAGGGIEDVGIIMQAMGRNLMREPYLPSIILGARLLAQLTGDEAGRWLEQALNGSKLITLAYAEPSLGYARSPLATRAYPDGDRHKIRGEKFFVLGGAAADAWLISAVDGAGLVGVYLVTRDDPGVVIQPYQTLDARVAAGLILTDAAALRLSDTATDAAPLIDSLLDFATVAVAHDAIGSMSRVVELATEHLNSRHQFGRPLASFQVLRHRLVDMYVALEESRSMAAVAGAALADTAAERCAAVSALKVQLCRAARFVGQQGVQLHGGMGMTHEFPISHHFKRLVMIEMLFGNAEFHLQRYQQVRAASWT